MLENNSAQVCLKPNDMYSTVRIELNIFLKNFLQNLTIIEFIYWSIDRTGAHFNTLFSSNPCSLLLY